MRPHFIFTACILVLCTLNSFSQSDYRSGYIITNDADTVRGLINYQGNKANATACHFKKEKDAKTIVYSPSQVVSYRFTESKYYLSRKVDSVSNTKVFLECLIDGTIDVYYYRDERSGEHYFLDKGNNKLIELRSDDIEVYVNNQRYVQKNNAYKGVLISVFAKSPTIRNRIPTLNLTHKSLIDITRDYHNEVCPNEICTIYQKKMPSKLFSWGIVIAGNYSMIRNNSNDYPQQLNFLTGVDFKPSFNMSVGLFLTRNMPAMNERLFFHYELSYHQRAFESLTEKKDNYSQVSDMRKFNLSINSINNVISFRYEFPSGRLRPVLHAGGFMDFFINSKLTREDTYDYQSSDDRVVHYDHSDQLSGIDYGLVLGAGVKFKVYKQKDILLDFRYNKGIGLLISTRHNLSTDNLSLCMQYPF